MDNKEELDNPTMGDKPSVVIPPMPIRRAPPENPLLKRFNTMPPETFRMPSGGDIYKNGEIADEVVDGEVIIYPMTTVDEITMRSPDMLFQGTAIDTVFKRCIPQVAKPLELLSNDVDYLLICLRMVTYGKTLEIYWDCPECNKDKTDTDGTDDGVKMEHRREGEEGSKEFLNVKPTYTIDLSTFIKTSRPLNAASDVFTVTLDTGEVVKLRPSTFGEMLKLYQYDVTKLKTPEEMTEFILDSLLAVVKSVDGVSNVAHIREWAGACEAPILEALQLEVHKANDWGTTEKYDFSCDKCGHSHQAEVPLNPVQFFTAPSTKKTKR